MALAARVLPLAVLLLGCATEIGPASSQWGDAFVCSGGCTASWEGGDPTFAGDKIVWTGPISPTAGGVIGAGLGFALAGPEGAVAGGLVGTATEEILTGESETEVSRP